LQVLGAPKSETPHGGELATPPTKEKAKSDSKTRLENVKHRPLRTFLSALLIAIPVTLVLTLTGLSKGMMEDATRRYRGVGADIVIRPRTSDFLSLGSATIDERLVAVIRKQPHVAVATGMVNQREPAQHHRRSRREHYQ